MTENPLKGEGGLRRLISAAQNSLAGLADALRCEVAFRLEVILAVILVPLAFWIGKNGVERALLIGSLLIVLVVELLNSAIEATVDRISLERHPLARRAKDLASAAVMLAFACAGLTWLLIFTG